MQDAVVECFLVLAIGLLAGGGGLVAQCLEYERCSKKRTCTSALTLRRVPSVCSFTNSIPATADVVFNPGESTSPTDPHPSRTEYVETTRGVCAPGERLTSNPISNAAECAPWRSWPSAINAEIGDPDAVPLHLRTCGRWIAAGASVVRHVEQWSFYDNARQRGAVEHADAAMFSSARLTGSDMGKVHSACTQVVVAGPHAIAMTARHAYAKLLRGIVGPITPERALQTVGWLSSHHCDAPAQLGVAIPASRFQPTVVDGVDFETGVLAETLFGVGEPATLQALAEQANEFVNAHAGSAAQLTDTDLARVVAGALGGGTVYEGEVLAQATPRINALHLLAQQTSTGPGMAAAFLKGVAAHCAFSMQSVLDATQSNSHTARSRSLRRVRSSRGEAVALGRLRDRDEPFADELTNETLLNASTATWAQLVAGPLGDATADCATLVRFLFPDRMDEVHFGGLVTDRLYARVQAMTETLRDAVAYVVERSTALRAVLQDPTRVAWAVRNTVVRIPGAPRGTWAGLSSDLVHADLRSEDTVMELALKQSRAIFLARMRLVTDNANPCDGPALLDGLVTNAYIYPGVACSHLLLGLLRKPFADERYDDASLFGRVGAIVAHEFAHNTLHTPWNTPALETLLSRYAPNVHTEAIADVVGAMALVHSGMLSARQVCEHFSQMWCGRTPALWQPDPEAQHPAVNVRGDALCATLADLGYDVDGL